MRDEDDNDGYNEGKNDTTTTTNNSSSNRNSKAKKASSIGTGHGASKSKDMRAEERPAKKRKVQPVVKSTEFVDSDIEMTEVRIPGEGSKQQVGPPKGKKKLEVVIGVKAPETLPVRMTVPMPESAPVLKAPPKSCWIM